MTTIACKLKHLRLLEAKARLTEFREMPKSREEVRELTPQERSRRRLWTVLGAGAAIGGGIWAANKIARVRRSTPPGKYARDSRWYDGTVFEPRARTAQRHAQDAENQLRRKVLKDETKAADKLKAKADYDAMRKRIDDERAGLLSDRRRATEFARGDQLLRGMLTRKDGSKLVRSGPLAHATFVGGRGYELQPWEEAAARHKYRAFAKAAAQSNPDLPRGTAVMSAVRSQLAVTARDGRQWQRGSRARMGLSAKKSPRLIQLHRNVIRATVEFNLRGEDGTFLPSLDPISNYRKGRRMVTGVRRTSEAAGDISDIIAGRPREPGKKRFYEKSWFHSAVLGAGIGGAYLGLKHYKRLNGMGVA